jgi:hypothetical protein
MEIPDRFRNLKIKGDRQRTKFTRDFLNFVSPQMACEFAEALMRGMRQNNAQAIRLAGEFMQVIKGKEAPQVTVQQNNTSNSVSIGDKAEKVTFDQIIRSRAEEKQKRLGASAVTIEASVAS